METQVFPDEMYIPDEYLDEQWARIPGFPSYRVSSYGRIWSYHSNSFLVLRKANQYGQLGCILTEGGRRQHVYIHRLVAEAFLPNPDGRPVVRHLDDRPMNHSVDNLSWGTQQDNVRDMHHNGHAYSLSNQDRERAYAVRRTPVIAENVKTGEKTHFISQCEAARSLGINQGAIANVLIGRNRTSGGYYWYYAEGRS